MTKRKAMLNYVTDVILGTAMLAITLLTINALFTRDIETVMIFAPWLLIIVLTIRVKDLWSRLQSAEDKLREAINGKPTVVKVTSQGGHR